MNATIEQIEQQLQTLTMLVRTLKKQVGVGDHPPKLTRKQREAYIVDRIIERNPLTKKEYEALNQQE
mgnify:CR=1 FL=1